MKGKKREEWEWHEGFISCHDATYLVRQCNMDPSESVRLAVWLDELRRGCSSGSSV
jgi:hypothetical protein